MKQKTKLADAITHNNLKFLFSLFDMVIFCSFIQFSKIFGILGNFRNRSEISKLVENS